MLVVDPMLATGGSIVHALDVLKRAGASFALLSLFGAPEKCGCGSHRPSRCADHAGCSTPTSTTSATSCLASAMPEIGSTAPSKAGPGARSLAPALAH